MLEFQDEKIRAAFSEFDPVIEETLLAARRLILSTAGDLDAVSSIEESLKWGQPSYASVPKTGTPIRLGVSKSGAATMFVHCQTTLVSDLEADNAHGLKTIDNRAVVLPSGDFADHPGVLSFVRSALTYHLS